MYPIESPYFYTENPVVRDELWDRAFYYDTEDNEEEIFEIDWTFDSKKHSAEELYELLRKIEEYSNYRVNVECFLEDDGSMTSFKVYGECDEEMYDEIASYLEYYNFVPITA